MNLETQKHTKWIEIYQSQITNLDLLKPFSKVLFPQRSVKMIAGSEKRKGQLVFELQSSHVYEKRSKNNSLSPAHIIRKKKTAVHENNFANPFSDFPIERY